MNWFTLEIRNVEQHNSVCVFLFLPDERKLNSLLLLSHFHFQREANYLICAIRSYFIERLS